MKPRSAQNSLYVQKNIAIEDDFEESAVKMISPFEYEISGPRDRFRNVLSQNYNLFTYSATEIAHRDIIQKEGNKDFHKQELKLNYLIKTRACLL